MADLDPRPAPPRRRAPANPLLLQMRRAYLWVGAAACAVSAALLAATVPPLGPLPWCAAAFGLLALVGAGATRLPDGALTGALTTLLALLIVAMAGTTLALDWGLASVGLPSSGLMVCAICIAAGWRAGAVLAAVAAAAVGLVAAQSTQTTAVPWALNLGAHWLAVAAGLACGAMASHLLARYLRSADEREDRFGRLLALAADAYWELDTRYRLVAVREHGREPRAVPRTRPYAGLGHVVWDLAQFHCEPDALDAWQADLDARLPFRDLPVRWTGSNGRERVYLAAGEPRFDDHGVFTGYWGVLRDVTAEQRAHEALAATDARYQELFCRIPTPLVLHRGGRVLDANPAALTMFGHAELASMVGSDLLAAYESGDSRERARRRMESLGAQGPGTALPVADFRLVNGPRVTSVRATSVVVDAEDGPAMLAIYVDDTERLVAEEAVRRSEAMLSHLVATSPDLITLTEMASGRYAMVNHSFERLSGWSATEAVGRTAAELGIWHDMADRERLVQQLREQGQASDLPMPFVAKSGQVFSLVVSAARFTMDRREYMVINARDVTERERQRLEREAILASASIGIALTRQRRFVLTNHHFDAIYGYAEGELLGSDGSALWHDAALHAEAGRLATAALGGERTFEIEGTGRRKDGSSFIALVRGRAIASHRADERAFIWIVEDVTGRRHAEQALARARDEAQAASRAKSAFLANTSHELRTPLNGMIGLARLARDPALPEARRLQYLDQIAGSAESLAAIISDILDLSKIEAGKLVIETTVFDLTAELHALHRTYGTLAAARGLGLRLELDESLSGWVTGDPLRVRQIVSNFVANAIKFTAEGWVLVSARRQPGGRVRLAVQDTGPGIDAEARERLFQPFSQADESTTRRYGGTGLGLSICRELAALMGGEVGVDSRTGEGSTFWAELPLPPSAEPPAAPAVAGSAAALAGLRVLMVEDNAVNMMIAVALLERWGVQVAQAHDGREALAAVQRAAEAGAPFQAVLMDVQMPVMGGHEATRLLREAGHRMPVIALTAAALVNERDAALGAGMNDFLTKPIDADKLQAALLRWRAAGPVGA